MSVDSIKRDIERFKREIDSQKVKVSKCREEMAKIRIRKSKEAIRYKNRLKSASSTASRHNIRSQKKRDWDGYARDLSREKGKVEKCRDRTSGYRDDIKRCRERIKRLKKR